MKAERDAGNLLVKSGSIIDPSWNAKDCDVLIENGVITGLGRFQPEDGMPVIDATGYFLLPGWVNAHMHSGENFNPGLYENLPLDLWFVHSHDVTRSAPPSPDAIYSRTMLGAALMLRNGTTCVVDFLYESPTITLQSLEAVVTAYTDIGMRATILLGVADKTFLDSLPLDAAGRSVPPEAPPQSLENVIELAEQAIDRWHDPGGLIGIGLAPSAPQRCSPELLRHTFELAQKADIVWHTHVLETKSHAYTAYRWYGRSFIRWLADEGYLGKRTSVVHAVWLTDEDIDLIAKSETTMIHCLLSNLRLGDGIARLPDLIDAGINIAMGTDGRGCDESLDMVELTKMTALVHKVHGRPYAEWPTARSVLKMATANGSIPAGRGTAIGRIEMGAAGDLVLLPRDALTMNPLNDPVRQVVYGTASRDVHTAIVDGKIIMQGGRFSYADMGNVLRDARRYASDTRASAGKKEDLDSLESLVREVYEVAESSDLGTAGYIRR